METTIFTRTRKLAILSSVLCLTLLATGCTNFAPKYEADRNNVKTLMGESFAPVNVGNFTTTTQTQNPTSITIRSISLFSPYRSYANYLKEALKLELSLADKYDPQADVVVDGVLLKNDLNSANGTGIIEATFSVLKQGKRVYTATILSTTEWPTSFLGAVAIPNGVKAYSPLVSSLLKKLYADKAFIAALGGNK